MNKREFIKEHRQEIDAAIHSVPGMTNYPLNDNDRAEWLANDEALYNWAKRNGVKL